MRQVPRAIAVVALAALAACHGDSGSAPRGELCGPATCAADRQCCNASCGTCVAPGGACTLQFCGQSPCSADSDCRTFSFACEACVCWALRRADPDPACPTTPVACLVDPCAGRSAVCDPATRACAIR